MVHHESVSEIPGEQRELGELERASIPVLEKPRSGSRVGRCPNSTGAEMYCWKFSNPDPGAHYDFFAIVTLLRSGDLMLITQSIPLDNGELLIVMRYNEYRITMSNKHVKTMKSQYSDFGVVQISRMEVREYCESIIRSSFTSKTNITKFDSNGNWLETKESDSFEFPPLPECKTS